MQEQMDFDRLTRNTRRLEFDDGLNDLQNALVFVLFSLAAALFFSPAGIRFYMRALLTNRELTIIALLALLPLFILITFGARRLIMRYRRQVLWKEIGQIEPLRWQVDRRTSLLAGAAWLVVAITGFVAMSGMHADLDRGMQVVVAAGGVATGLVYFMMGASLQLARYRWVGVIAGTLSAALLFVPLSGVGSWLAFGGIWTVTLLVSGLGALRRTLSALERGAA